MAGLEEWRQNIQALSKGMSAGQKLTIGLTVLITVVGFVMLFRWATKPDYALLFSNLDLKEADNIVQELRNEGVPYEIAAGGSTIRIPSTEVYEWRMRLATEGLPSNGGIGYEVFDKKDIGISDFVQQINFRRALEGELSRTIRGLGGIDQARVHIVIPEDRLFKEDQQDASASIVLKLLPGCRIHENQVNGITNLVAASVEGLEADQVTVVDSEGNILSSQWENDSAIGMSSSQYELQRKVESYLETKAQSMLAAVLGPNKSIVRVTAELDFQKIERTDERYDPDNVAVLSEETTTETNTATEGVETGSVEHLVTNNLVPRTVEHITNSVGDVQRLSVAVLIDGSQNDVVADDGTTTTEYVPRTTEEMAMLTEVIQNAVGYDPLRNDQLSIRNIPFETPTNVLDEEAYNPMTQPEFWIDIGQKVVPVLFLFILILILRSRLRRVRLSLPPVAAAAGGVPLTSIAGASEETPVGAIDEEAPPEAVESAKLLKQISNFASEKPSMAARLLRYWMIEE